MASETFNDLMNTDKDIESDVIFVNELYELYPNSGITFKNKVNVFGNVNIDKKYQLNAEKIDSNLIYGNLLECEVIIGDVIYYKNVNSDIINSNVINSNIVNLNILNGNVINGNIIETNYIRYNLRELNINFNNKYLAYRNIYTYDVIFSNYPLNLNFYGVINNNFINILNNVFINFLQFRIYNNVFQWKLSTNENFNFLFQPINVFIYDLLGIDYRQPFQNPPPFLAFWSGDWYNSTLKENEFYNEIKFGNEAVNDYDMLIKSHGNVDIVCKDVNITGLINAHEIHNEKITSNVINSNVINSNIIYSNVINSNIQNSNVINGNVINSNVINNNIINSNVINNKNYISGNLSINEEKINFKLYNLIIISFNNHFLRLFFDYYISSDQPQYPLDINTSPFSYNGNSLSLDLSQLSNSFQSNFEFRINNDILQWRVIAFQGIGFYFTSSNSFIYDMLGINWNQATQQNPYPFSGYVWYNSSLVLINNNYIILGNNNNYDKNIKFFVNDTEKLKITNSNVLISNDLFINGNITSNFINCNNNLFVSGNITCNNNLFVSEKVGIGIFNPTEKLHINGNLLLSDGSKAIIKGYDEHHSIHFRTGYDGINNTLNFYEYGDIRFYTGGLISQQQERMKITSSGSVAINTLTPLEKLHVEGNLICNSGIKIKHDKSWHFPFEDLALTNNFITTSLYDLQFIPSYVGDGPLWQCIEIYNPQTGSLIEVNLNILYCRYPQPTPPNFNIYNGISKIRMNLTYIMKKVKFRLNYRISTNYNEDQIKIIRNSTNGPTILVSDSGYDTNKIFKANSIDIVLETNQWLEIEFIKNFTALTTFEGVYFYIENLNIEYFENEIYNDKGNMFYKSTTNHLFNNDVYVSSQIFTNYTGIKEWHFGTEKDLNGNFIIYKENNTGAWLSRANPTGWSFYSDRNIKKNIINLDNELNKICNLQPIKYNFLSENDDDNKHYGLIAQDTQLIYPEIVNKGTNDLLGINYQELIPSLISSIKELNKKVEHLEKIISNV